MHMRHALSIAALCGLWLGCSAPSHKSKRAAPDPAFTVIVTSEVRGTIEPCGCNSDPLGDIARTAEIVSSLRSQGRAVLVLDGGSLLYTEPRVPKHLEAQESLRSDLIVDIYSKTLQAAAIGLGPYDFGAGKEAIRPARQAANVPADSGIAIEPPKIVEAGGVKVGIFGVVSPAAVEPFGISASDPVEAAKTAVASLRDRGARVVIGLAHMTDAEAKRLAKKVPGIDFLVAGQNAPEPDQVRTAPGHAGDTFVFTPANRGQVVTRLDITVRDGQGPLIDAIGEARAESELEDLAERIQELEAQLQTWAADPDADASFVAAKKQELGELEERANKLRASPLQVPPSGSYFTMEQIAIRKSLPCNLPIQAAKQAFDKAAGEANVAAAKGQTPRPPDPGQPGYVGVEACIDCHDEAVSFWEKTNHHQAWDTLERLGKQFDYECVSCHVTGWDQPGGSNLAVNEHLRDVQCEVCHGPASLHVPDGDPATIQRTPPESLCKGCHNEQHSDTFDYTPYLRDVTGEGHGGAFRQELGEGKTGRELRAAALAGKTLGAGCVK